MILAVDIGNTNIVVGLLDKANIINSARLATDKKKTDDIVKGYIEQNAEKGQSDALF